MKAKEKRKAAYDVLYANGFVPDNELWTAYEKVTVLKSFCDSDYLMAYPGDDVQVDLYQQNPFAWARYYYSNGETPASTPGAYLCLCYHYKELRDGTLSLGDFACVKIGQSTDIAQRMSGINSKVGTYEDNQSVFHVLVDFIPVNPTTKNLNNKLLLLESILRNAVYEKWNGSQYLNTTDHICISDFVDFASLDIQALLDDKFLKDFCEENDTTFLSKQIM